MSTFEYTDEHGTHLWKSAYFVEQALNEALIYNDNTKLEIAIRHGLPELLETEQAREAMLLALNGGIKKRGFKPGKNKHDAERNSLLWKQIHWYEGKGYPVWSRDHRCACELAGNNLGLTKDQVYRIYRDWGGKKPKSIPLQLAASFYRSSAKNETEETNPLIKSQAGIK